MNLLSLKVKNFRAFEGIENEVKIFFHKGITAIVGENNVGKSSLLRALRIISDQIGLDNNDFYKGEGSDEQSIELNFEIDSKEMTKFLSYTFANSDFLKDSSTLKRFATDLGNHFTLGYSRKFGRTLQTKELMFRTGHLELKNYNRRKFSVIKLNSFFQKYIADNELDVVSFLKNTYSQNSNNSRGFFIECSGNPEQFFQKILKQKIKVFSEIRKRPAGEIHRIFESLDGGEVAAVLFALKNGNKREQKKYDLIKQEFSKLFPNLELDARLGETNQPKLFIDKKSIDFDMPIENVGAGIGEMIILLTHLIATNDVIFGLDLPEMQFHPHAQRLLLKVLEDHSKNNQIIVITHSPFLLNSTSLKNIVIIRERNGKSIACQLPENFFSKNELIKLEQLLNDRADFFFSRATLIIEGPTEAGAMPIFAEKIGLDLDINSISIVKMEGNHFGLWDKLLTGFNIPHVVMCDRDVLMNINGSISYKKKKIKTSSVFCCLYQANHLTEEEKKKISKYENTIITTEGKEIYQDSLYKELQNIAENHNIYPLSSDFEGILRQHGFGELLKEASSISRSKAIQGKFAAKKLVKNGIDIPLEFTGAIKALENILREIKK